METETVQALRALTYGGIARAWGDVFEMPRRDARALVAVGRVKRVAPRRQDLDDLPEDATRERLIAMADAQGVHIDRRWNDQKIRAKITGETAADDDAETAAEAD